MKKIMIGFATIAIAVVANATAIQWSSGAVSDINKQKIGTVAADAGWLASVSFWDASGENLISTSGLTKNTSGMSSFSSTTGNDFATMTTYMAQLVVTDKAGNSITSEKASFTTTGATTYALNFGTGNGFPDSKSQIDYSSGWMSADVPEPTSGLLMLLGFAGLALRRRRA